MAKERLQKYIANCGYCSRRKAELLIEAGLVRVNGEVVRELGVKVDPARHTVHIHDEQIVSSTRQVVALHKPSGFITSTHDTHDRLTVMDLLPRRIAETGVLPAGRLDLETEGLLILTNDGDLQHRITHPRYECEKEYYVELDRTPTDAELTRLRNGIYLRDLDRETAPADLYQIERRADGTTTLMICISEGMKRQIRRMFEAIGLTVVYLKRLTVGGVALADLPRGEWRALTPEEIASLDGTGEDAAGGSEGGGPTRRGAFRRERGATFEAKKQDARHERESFERAPRGERGDRDPAPSSRPRQSRSDDRSGPPAARPWREKSSEQRHRREDRSQRPRADERTSRSRDDRSEPRFEDRSAPPRDRSPRRDDRPSGGGDRGRPKGGGRPPRDASFRASDPPRGDRSSNRSSDRHAHSDRDERPRGGGSSRPRTDRRPERAGPPGNSARPPGGPSRKPFRDAGPRDSERSDGKPRRGARSSRPDRDRRGGRGGRRDH